MIVRPRPNTLDLLFALRGSVVPLVAPRVLLVTGIALMLALLDQRYPGIFPEFSAAPFTVLGLTLSIFLSFRNNACHARWWEGRQLWGRLITENRVFARLAIALLPEDDSRARLLRRVAGFAHLLAMQLRGRDGLERARPWLPAEEAAALATRRNRPDAVLRAQSAELAGLLRAGALTDILHTQLSAPLAEMTGIQAGCERIHNTPLPYAYSLLLHRSAWLFCLLMPFGFVGTLGFGTPVVVAILAYTLFGLDALGDELEDPFGDEANDLALDAMVRVIETDLLEALGETDLPAPLQPTRYLLR
ncbi:bestrophin family ion channel [Roseomonas gilardii]|uniref:Bestrophin n=1 Tax=Roseomonas gilardii TaxID=257708 RepID=A0A1L7AAM0_9PROT|nr:bestrophin family ion channel [Roseomonas gilardii]APT55760.1 bestrophin [Roseomonas gilardii]MDT8333169.1 bestrophin family ion channel [Roseomonas gilardii]